MLQRHGGLLFLLLQFWSSTTTAQPAALAVEPPSRCFLRLLHGKYDEDCLREENITRTPCVRPALITGTSGSGTARTAALFRVAGFHAVWQDHGYVDGDEDAELLVSWFSRADVEGLRRASGFHWPWKARYWELPPFDATTPPLKPENL